MSHRVKVDQQDGEITMTGEGFDEPRTWRVQDGYVSAANLFEVDRLLAHVDGAKRVDDPAGKDDPEPETPAGDEQGSE